MTQESQQRKEKSTESPQQETLEGIIVSVRDVVTRFLEAENRRDWTAYRSFLADDVAWTLMGSGRRVVRGINEYMATIRAFYEQNPDATFTIERLVVDEPTGVAFAELDMAGRKSIDVFETRAGRIAVEREYFGY